MTHPPLYVGDKARALRVSPASPSINLAHNIALAPGVKGKVEEHAQTWCFPKRSLYTKISCQHGCNCGGEVHMHRVCCAAALLHSCPVRAHAVAQPWPHLRLLSLVVYLEHIYGRTIRRVVQRDSRTTVVQDMMSRPSTSRKRNMVLRLFPGHGSLQSAPPNAATATASQLTQTNVHLNTAPSTTFTSTTQQSTTILDQALSELTNEEKAAIQRLLPKTASHAGAALDEIHAKAKDLQEVCNDKSWRWHFRGREIVLREEVDRVLRLLDRFKSVGDVVANIDPVHVGLPWAGVRTILEVRQMCYHHYGQGHDD